MKASSRLPDVLPLDELRLHPDAQRVPMADSTDLNHLRTSLREFGQQDPLDITEDGVILDGRTRWTLLKELGFKDAVVRVVDVPEAQQTGYIVDRALSRRHLTAAQKQALNGLLRSVVVEVAPNARGEDVKIGMGQSQRAEKLGVTRMTVRNWDQEPVKNYTGSEPTHYRQSHGLVQPIHLERTTPPARPQRMGKASKENLSSHGGRPAPWRTHFTRWCRGALAEDKRVLLEMDAELHNALRLIGVEGRDYEDGAA